MNNSYNSDFSTTGDRVNLSLIKKMKKTTKSLKIRHHQQTIKRIEILINMKCIRKNVGSVLAALASYANKSGICFPSQSTISDITDYKRETVNRLIKKLEALGFIKKHNNRKPLIINDKVYFPRTIYKICIDKITKTLKSKFDDAKKLKLIADAKHKLKKAKEAKLERQAKTDHSATPKTDHTNKQAIKRLNINTATKDKPVSKLSFLDKLFKNANAHEENHFNKLKIRSARQRGFKNWQVKNGLIKSDEAIKQERKASNALSKARQAVKPLLDSFSTLQAKLMQWNAKINPNAFTDRDHKELERVKREMVNKNIPLPTNVIADYKLNEFVSFNR